MEPVSGMLTGDRQAQRPVDVAIHGGLHRIELDALDVNAREDLRLVIVDVRDRPGIGDLSWGTAQESVTFVGVIDSLLAMLDEPG
jgi:hypothetical protein